MHCLNLKGLFVPSFLMHMGDCHRYYGRLTTSLMPAQNERPQSPILWLLFSHLSNNSISTRPDPRFTVSIRPFWSRTPMRCLTVCDSMLVGYDSMSMKRSRIRTRRPIIVGLPWPTGRIEGEWGFEVA
jgi:hypothetical protein